jgi:hypothetical protein
MKRGITMALAVLLAGCAAQPKPVFIRLDGQSIAGNPVLAQQFEIDKTICEGDTQKANMAGVNLCRGTVDCLYAGIERNNQMLSVAKGCMAQHGYMLVAEEEAEAKKAELRGLAKQQQVKR